MDKKARMKELVQLLRNASRAYYAEDREIMSNYEYDRLYEELEELEKETGTVLANSPTVQVGYEAVDELPKEAHESPMLSLDKTKDVEQLRAFIGGHRTLLSWKLDGLTIVLTYQGGILEKAVTRGNGTIGEVVTNNARTFVNLPLRIPFQGELILRGEAIITYDDFEKINAEIEDVDSRYKNPRNLCSGSVRQLNNEITARRNVRFCAFSLVRAVNPSGEAADFSNSREQQFLWLQSQGFETVQYRVVTSDTLDEAIAWFSEEVSRNSFPSDGLVALYDDIAYGDSLGTTAKFPRNSYAFKWADEKKKTRLKEIEWSPSRTGLLNPVAIFEPVELEGTTVSRASVHNVSILRELQLGIGDEIEVYKANMIIPQIAENLTRSGTVRIPETCPVCGAPTAVHAVNEAESLYCENPACPAKAIQSYALFVSRDAMNIEGMSEATLEKFMAHGLIHSCADLFRIDRHREIIIRMDGFGEKSYEKLWEGVQNARKTVLSRLLFALGIPNIGVATARLISRSFGEDPRIIPNVGAEELSGIEGIGPVTAGIWENWWKDDVNRGKYLEILPYLTFEKEYSETTDRMKGMTFVITGSLNHFENRNALKSLIELQGGKVAGSVSSKTDYLINNDVLSGSSKNRKARELSVPILSEEDFMEQFGIKAEGDPS